MWNFYTFLLQICSGNCLQKIGILDLSLIKLSQNEQGCNFLPHSVCTVIRANSYGPISNLHRYNDVICLRLFAWFLFVHE